MNDVINQEERRKQAITKTYEFLADLCEEYFSKEECNCIENDTTERKKDNDQE